MKKKLRVAVMMGGNSPEHNISLVSGREVVRHLDPEKYEILPITISRDGKTWEIGEREKFLGNSPTPELKIAGASSKDINPIVVSEANKLVKNQAIDVVFIAMHGAGGEDGKVQALLELNNIRYTGSGVLASALGMNKKYSRKLFSQAELTVPQDVIVDKNYKLAEIWKKLKLPVFVKPSTAGSSVGITKVKEKKDLKAALENALKYSDEVLVDEYIEGTEVTCAVIGNEKLTALPVVEIVTKNEFFDYEAKYSEAITDEIVPARISPKLTKRVQATAITAYQALGCRGFGRVDMIIKGDQIYVLEVNTIPGLTPVSLMPRAAKAAGIAYDKLLDKVIDLSLE